MKYIKSPLNYTGGKYRLLNRIIPRFPKEIDTFIDLFAGGYNVGININADKIIANDHNTFIIDIFKELKKETFESVDRHINLRINDFELTLENREGFNKFRKFYNESDESKKLDLMVLAFYSFNHQIRFNNSHKYNTPFGYKRSSYNESIKQNLFNFMNKLNNQNVIFSSLDFLDIDMESLTEDSLVYCDPPYLISTAVYNDGKRGFKNWTSKEEKELLNLLDKLNDKGVKFALSNVLYHKGIENTLLIEWSKKYNIHYMKSNFNNSSYQLKDRTGKTVEVLITNYE